MKKQNLILFLIMANLLTINLQAGFTESMTEIRFLLVDIREGIFLISLRSLDITQEI